MCLIWIRSGGAFLPMITGTGLGLWFLGHALAVESVPPLHPCLPGRPRRARIRRRRPGTPGRSRCRRTVRCSSPGSASVPVSAASCTVPFTRRGCSAFLVCLLLALTFLMPSSPEKSAGDQPDGHRARLPCRGHLDQQSQAHYERDEPQHGLGLVPALLVWLVPPGVAVGVHSLLLRLLVVSG